MISHRKINPMFGELKDRVAAVLTGGVSPAASGSSKDEA
jgi:hypothetical protein